MHLALRGRIGAAALVGHPRQRDAAAEVANALPGARHGGTGVTSGDRRFHTTLRSDAARRAWWCMRARARCAPPVHHLRAWTQ